VKEWQNSVVSILLYPTSSVAISYKTPDFAYLHTEMSKRGITLNLLWVEYCDHYRLTGEIPHKSTQFYKLYRDHLQKNKATMHLEHKRGELMKVDWAETTPPFRTEQPATW